MKAPSNWTKGQVIDAITMGRNTPNNRKTAVTWTVGGVTVTAKPCNDGRGGYWIKAAGTDRMAWIRRFESCFDAEGIAHYLRSEDAQPHKLCTFDRHGNAHPFKN
jgi:hypothetical protein